MVIIGLKTCPACKTARVAYPDYRYIEIPDIALGFGDTISKITKFFGIETCKQCRYRQYKINQWIPYKWRVSKVDRDIIKAKELAYKFGVVRFPAFANDDLTAIIQ